MNITLIPKLGEMSEGKASIGMTLCITALTEILVHMAV